jgi:hypothetical protein
MELIEINYGVLGMNTINISGAEAKELVQGNTWQL